MKGGGKRQGRAQAGDDVMFKKKQSLFKSLLI